MSTTIAELSLLLIGSLMTIGVSATVFRWTVSKINGVLREIEKTVEVSSRILVKKKNGRPAT